MGISILTKVYICTDAILDPTKNLKQQYNKAYLSKSPMGGVSRIMKYQVHKNLKYV